MNSKNELADKLKKEAEHFSGAQDLVEMLLDAEAMIRNLHTENTALRVTEDNLRQELKECQDQRQAAFRRIAELERQLEETLPDQTRYLVGDLTLEQVFKQAGLTNLCDLQAVLDQMEKVLLVSHEAQNQKAATAPQKPLTDEQIEQISQQIERSDFFDCVIPFARAIEAAHGIKE